MKADFPTISLAVVLLCLFTGSLLAYSLNPNSFDASVENTGSEITVDLHSSIQSDYVVCAVGLRTSDPRDLSFYCGDDAESAESSSRLAAQLRYTNTPHTDIDREGLVELIHDVTNAYKHAVVVFAGSLPTETSSAEIKAWMVAGGIIYWYSDEKFGADDPEFGLVYLENSEKSYASNRSDISNLLDISQNMVMGYAPSYGLNRICLGYEADDGRCSIAFYGYGNGGIVILGGEWTEDMSMAKVISSRVCEWTSLPSADCYRSGTFKGDAKITLTSATADAVYIQYGTLEPRFAKLVLLV